MIMRGLHYIYFMCSVLIHSKSHTTASLLTMILCRIVKNLQYQSYRISFGPPQNVAKSGREEKLGIPRRRKADADPLQRMGIEQKCFEARRVKRARSSVAFLNF